MSALPARVCGATLHVALEARQPIAPEHGVSLGPLCDLAQRSWGELVDPLPAVLASPPLAHEPSVAQHPEVARHRGARHGERGSELRHGGVAVAELVEDRPPRRIGDGEERIGVSDGTGHGIWVSETLPNS